MLYADHIQRANPVIRLGFWPGGDRDGNPFVTADITLKVAEALRGGIIKCYYLDVRRIKRRLTFQRRGRQDRGPGKKAIQLSLRSC